MKKLINMAWTKSEFRENYSKLAGIYDPGMWLYRGIGLRIERYRQTAVNALLLKPGDTVIDLGCGTGLNFSYLHDAVGEGGRIIGVDLTPAMLDQAKRKVTKAGWNNVNLVEADMSRYSFPANANGVLATLSLATIPDYENVIARAARELSVGTAIAEFDLQWPDNWPKWLAHFAALLNRPADAILKYFDAVETRTVYFGAGVICSGIVPQSEQ